MSGGSSFFLYSRQPVFQSREKLVHQKGSNTSIILQHKVIDKIKPISIIDDTRIHKFNTAQKSTQRLNLQTTQNTVQSSWVKKTQPKYIFQQSQEKKQQCDFCCRL